MSQNGIVVSRRAVKIINWLFIVAIMIFLVVIPIRDSFKYERTEIFSETSPDGKYNVVIYDIGLPPFKDSDTMEIVVSPTRISRYLIDTFSVTAHNECTTSFEVEWFNDRVDVTVYAKGQSNFVYTFPFVKRDSPGY